METLATRGLLPAGGRRLCHRQQPHAAGLDLGRKRGHVQQSGPQMRNMVKHLTGFGSILNMFQTTILLF